MKIRRTIALLFSALLPLVLLISCSGKKSNVPEQSDVFYIYDEADVLDGKTEEYVIGKNIDLFDKCGGQIVVACVNTTGSYDIKDYAYAVFNKWKIGSADKNNGVLILLSIDEDDYWVLQGKGLESLLQSGTLKLLLNDYLEPYFAKKQYSAGVRALFDALIEKYEQIYSVTIVEAEHDNTAVLTPNNGTQQSEENKVTFWSVVTAIASVVVAFTVIVIALVIIVSIVVTIFIIFATALGSGSGNSSAHTFRSSGGININPNSFRSSGTYHGGSFGGTHRSSGFTFGGFSSGRSGGFSSGRSSGGFSSGRSGGFSGGHHGGGGGFSRGGGAGRR
jgi:uncharacterized protein